MSTPTRRNHVYATLAANIDALLNTREFHTTWADTNRVTDWVTRRTP